MELELCERRELLPVFSLEAALARDLKISPILGVRMGKDDG